MQHFTVIFKKLLATCCKAANSLPTGATKTNKN